ncbi:UDP-glucosyltransferase UGT13248-like [Hordeum vulgare subsp. vulgare]|uniref:Glycosyltransferase n=1 Tax=Hordeum vulgare subsp. vulgare TaxID=112509 RepID=A0A8I6WQQ5_HORVV|nr:UDP-glucosyltransferase UGT13248-like [Hordeum vulgare subsp. vulgare]
MDAAVTTVQATGGRVLLLPFPGMQGHANPMLQLGRRLAYHGLRPTLVLTRHVLSTTPTSTTQCPFPVAAISDGFDAGGIASCADTAEYLRRMEAAGSDTLSRLLLADDDPVRVLVYDSHLPWARRVACEAGVAAAAFFTQMCAVDVVYGEASAGRVALPLADGGALRGRLSVELGPDDVPPFVAAPQWYPAFTESALSQFDGLDQADHVLVNSFRDLEPMEAGYMESKWGAKTVGPTLPSFYLEDDRLPSNKTYGFNLVSSSALCMAWLDKQAPCSVLLASYGTVANLKTTQLEELGNGLCNSRQPFLWVLRSNEADKLPQELHDKCNMKGLIVPFCPQLEVLAHRATGCFLTHCGWNSTTEAIVAGVPMVAIPQWADQPTAAKYVESTWGIGLRARRDEKGLVTREEVERCIKEVMGGEEYKRNSCMWMQKAKEAMQEGGSSDSNIADFAAKYLSN